MTNKNAVIVFAKLPEEGKVKTRLAQTTSADFALNFYKECTEYLFNELRRLPRSTDVIIYHANPGKENEVKDWVGYNFIYKTQGGNDLGEKMSNAFKECFEAGYTKVLIMGTDVPDLNFDYFRRAFSELEKYDVVISPSTDGGYNLLGQKKLHRFLYEQIEWSTPSVLAETIFRLESNERTYTNLNQLIDIDTEDDLKNWLLISSTHPIYKKIKNKYESLSNE
ncbi:MAG: TIGR04282 family arsenosugar biosynthesis glycosyltransferase [Melioribacteraceae bacterium]|nr:TIGR04282 family arsenosugar biosynthesis glycosyltransferase [Melioribacteraceae bacterium]MCF8264486.1 TIGR04282 family arsenosugar biosynthesis glycosyltransferase [Melioribacteraceae bacterium]MCF8411927.1 TIGR04282 family arsenosugar biosynthesis glycosyltransferase [Melioribacteraceae bacterium]MCF8430938.1 TIGR04282 family arsenosugar biosynthesis glycosyltransferase [Melioribacteraceae bacterium]